MADKKDIATRFGTLFLAGLFLVTSVGFTALILWQSWSNSDESNEANMQTTEQQASSCEFDSPPAAAEAVPEVFIPEGDVTELQVTDLVPGDGTEVTAGNCLIVKYNGTLATDGTKFDGNFDKPTALKFTVGTGNVIPGWDEGLIGMKVGGTRRLVIPSDMAYGETGSPPTIPANADLVFVVKLLEIQEAQ